MRVAPKLILLCALIQGAAPACAHMEPPPGGPEDQLPPGILVTNPAHEAIVPAFDEPVTFEFDERITRQGITEAITVSPRTSLVEIRHGRSSIRVSMREGWEPDIIYHVTVLPEVRDLFGNALPVPYRLVFSTGPELPATQLTGRVTDRITGLPVDEARLEAIRTADSLVYAVATDSAGRFTLDRFPAGDYQVRSFPDANNNRSLDGFEARDSTFVTIGPTDPVDVALSVLRPDSTPPVAASATADSARVRVEFDDYLDPPQALDVGQATILHPTSGEVALSGITIGTGATAGGGAAPAGAGGAAPAASAGPLPSRTLLLDLADGAELVPDIEYRITLRGIRNVNGVVGDSETTLEIEPPPAAP